MPANTLLKHATDHLVAALAVAEKAGDAVLTVVVEMALMRARELPKEQDGQPHHRGCKTGSIYDAARCEPGRF